MPLDEIMSLTKKDKKFLTDLAEACTRAIVKSKNPNASQIVILNELNIDINEVIRLNK